MDVFIVLLVTFLLVVAFNALVSWRRDRENELRRDRSGRMIGGEGGGRYGDGCTDAGGADVGAYDYGGGDGRGGGFGGGDLGDGGGGDG